MLLEFALVVPFLLLIAMGIVEYGMAWQAANNVNSAARDAARSGTSAPAYATADRTILSTIGLSLSATELAGVQKVIVFRATNANDTMPSATCQGLSNSSGDANTIGNRVGVGGSDPHPCNVYGRGQISYVLNHPSDDAPWVTVGSGGSYSCPANSIDSYWCPSGRSHSLDSGSLDYLGVYIQMKHSSITHFGFGDQTIQRSAVFRLEPQYGGS